MAAMNCPALQLERFTSTKDLEQVLHQCHLLNPEWIPFALAQCSKDQFWPDFKVGYQAFINVWSKKLDDSDAIHLNEVLLNARQVPNGYVPDIHRVLLILKKLDEKPSKENLRFLVFEAGILCTIILSPQHDEELLSQHKAGLRKRCEDLQSLSSDETVTMVMNTASSATNIILIGCLQAWAEANRQRLLHDRLGEPLISAVVHLYTFYRLQEAVSVSPQMDKLNSRFEKLIFWDGRPKDVSSCRKSASEWIADKKGRSRHKKDFFKNLFNPRKRRMTDSLLLIMILGGNVKQESMSSAQGTTPLAEMDQDCHGFFLLRTFVYSIDNVLPRDQERAALKLVREIHEPTLDKTYLELLEAILSQWSKSRAIP